jgi:hypothetical protein
MAFFVTAFNIMRTELTPISRESACGAMRGDEGATQYHGRVPECLRCSAGSCVCVSFIGRAISLKCDEGSSGEMKALRSTMVGYLSV